MKGLKGLKNSQMSSNMIRQLYWYWYLMNWKGDINILTICCQLLIIDISRKLNIEKYLLLTMFNSRFEGKISSMLILFMNQNEAKWMNCRKYNAICTASHTNLDSYYSKMFSWFERKKYEGIPKKLIAGSTSAQSSICGARLKMYMYTLKNYWE